ncbi:MAG: hypothetical protein ACRC33_21980 [Gemmataceae bacterium]
MRARLTAILLAALAGCDPAPRANLIGPVTPPAAQRSDSMSGNPGTEASAKRTLAVAQRIYDANTQLGVRPTIMTVGRPEREIFHDGHGGLRGCRLFLTEGLITACRTDAELAAVLCVELGRIAAERAASAGGEDDDGRATIDERVGNDSGGSFGAPDGTRLMEAARRERQAKDGKLAPDPTKCAAEYLRRADYPAQALLEVGPLLRQAEESEAVRELVQPATLAAPVKPKAAP